MPSPPDAPRTLPDRLTAAATRPAAVAGVAVVIAYSALAAYLDPFTIPIMVVTSVPCVALAAWAIRRGWHRPGPRVPAAGGVTSAGWLAVWMVVIGVIAVFQLGMYFSSPRELYPTFSEIASGVFSWRPARAATFAAWLGMGWYLVER